MALIILEAATKLHGGNLKLLPNYKPGKESLWEVSTPNRLCCITTAKLDGRIIHTTESTKNFVRRTLWPENCVEIAIDETFYSLFTWSFSRAFDFHADSGTKYHATSGHESDDDSTSAHRSDDSGRSGGWY